MNRQERAGDFLGRWLMLALVVALTIFLVAAALQAFPPFGDFPQRQWLGFHTESIGTDFNVRAASESGNRNIVAAVMWDYRGFDTLGEATVLFTAVCAAAALFRNREGVKSSRKQAGNLVGDSKMGHGMTVIVKVVARILCPIALLFGVYVVAHGHLTPGGGFAGGVIVASAVIMLILAYGIDGLRSRITSHRLEAMDAFGSFLLVVVGIASLLAGVGFMTNIFPKGGFGTLFSGGAVPLYNLGTGLHVAAGLLTVVLAFILAGGDQAYRSTRQKPVAPEAGRGSEC
ncbi:Domain related to MnhB subunit of Na+/H+ antiporter [Neomoorella glycerini]|uniref:Domain related to MnhB subunit of Na+/H+ antiporter n=2 Tax=Neomoorella glycerini TaxID=55779 RepID=A0A6I5ZMC3_9FIRM|nr:Domain related to MnhB subunit of Na+/H+ antiporter [Moorella glycerini]